MWWLGLMLVSCDHQLMHNAPSLHLHRQQTREALAQRVKEDVAASGNL